MVPEGFSGGVGVRSVLVLVEDGDSAFWLVVAMAVSVVSYERLIEMRKEIVVVEERKIKNNYFLLKSGQC